MRFLIILILLAAIFSCQSKPGKIAAKLSHVPACSDTEYLRKIMEKSPQNDVDVAEVLFNYDTLKIVLTADCMYYPFGKHTDINFIAEQVTNSKIENIYLTEKNNNDSSKAIRINTAKSQMTFYFDEEQNKQQIVSAHILDTNFHFKNKIRLGMKKQDFMNMFFSKPLNPPSSIIKLISTVDGINHYYYFNDDKLAEIRMTTDYIFDNKD